MLVRKLEAIKLKAICPIPFHNAEDSEMGAIHFFNFIKMSTEIRLLTQQ